MTNEELHEEATTDKEAAEAPVAEAEPEGRKSPGLQVYQREVDGFREDLKNDPDAALNRYGFVCFHSIPPEEHFLLRDGLGFKPKTATDHYNLGVAHAASDDLKKAIECWQKALASDPDLAEAECNLAVAYERLSDPAKARIHYERYQAAVAADPEEIERVREHVAEMQA